ncbi:MAG TPA: hypothetical protein P5040_03095, partial [Smithella sp.]|nr:hypothetical protein [Smithella sp.]
AWWRVVNTVPFSSSFSSSSFSFSFIKPPFEIIVGLRVSWLSVWRHHPLFPTGRRTIQEAITIVNKKSKNNGN